MQIKFYVVKMNLFKDKYIRFYWPEEEELSIVFPSLVWPGQHKLNYVIKYN